MPADEPANYEKAWLGDHCRLEIPLQSVVNLRRVAEELRGLAAHLDRISRYEPNPLSAVLEVRRLVSGCNRKLVAIRGRGRPKKPRVHSLRWVR